MLKYTGFAIVSSLGIALGAYLCGNTVNASSNDAKVAGVIELWEQDRRLVQAVPLDQASAEVRTAHKAHFLVPSDLLIQMAIWHKERATDVIVKQDDPNQDDKEVLNHAISFFELIKQHLFCKNPSSNWRVIGLSC